MNLALLIFMTKALAGPGDLPANGPDSTHQARTAPAIPVHCATPERQRLAAAAQLIVNGNFKEAAALLQTAILPSKPRIYIDWAPVPEEARATFKTSFDSAIADWNSSLKGLMSFQQTRSEKDADVIVLFERRVPLLGMEAQLSALGDVPRRERAYVGIFQSGSNTLRDQDSAKRLAARALGMYLGLSMPTKNAGEAAGGVAADIAPSDLERDSAKRLQEVRITLLQYAQRHALLKIPAPAILVEKPLVDGGEVLRGDLVHADFTVKNTGEAPLEIVAKPGCGCTLVEYDKTIPPGGAGHVLDGRHAARAGGWRNRPVRGCPARSRR